jgi:hypothetical protein
MGTPSVDYDTHYTEFENTFWQTNCVGTVYDYNSYYDPTIRIADKRPASVNSPMSASGWRNPAGYFRQKLRGTLRVPGTISLKYQGACVAPKFQTLNATAFSSADDFIFPAEVPPVWVSDSAASKAFAKLKNEQANFSVMFAERKETAELFSNAATDIAKAVKKFRNGFPKDWGNVIKNEGTANWRKVPHRWLELQYGWNPLMADVNGACQALSHRERDGDGYHAHVKGNQKHTEISKSRWDFGFGAGGLLYQDITYLHTFESTVRLWYNLDNPSLASFASLGLTNPLELVWERIPYSFVVDWFLPVGGWLSTLDADFGWTFRASCSTAFSRVKGLGVPGSNTNGTFYETTNNSSPFRMDAFRFYRTTGGPPGVGLPHFKNPFSSTHIANALSLLTNAFH